MSFHAPDKYRVRVGDMAPELVILGAGLMNGNLANNGFFKIPAGRKNKYALSVHARDVDGWEHVSVATAVRCPTWEEMCLVKKLFRDPEDCVVQYHPPESEYVNIHPYCLHFWRPIRLEVPRPPVTLV